MSALLASITNPSPRGRFGDGDRSGDNGGCHSGSACRVIDLGTDLGTEGLSLLPCLQRGQTWGQGSCDSGCAHGGTDLGTEGLPLVATPVEGQTGDRSGDRGVVPPAPSSPGKGTLTDRGVGRVERPATGAGPGGGRGPGRDGHGGGLAVPPGGPGSVFALRTHPQGRAGAERGRARGHPSVPVPVPAVGDSAPRWPAWAGATHCPIGAMSCTQVSCQEPAPG